MATLKTFQNFKDQVKNHFYKFFPFGECAIWGMGPRMGNAIIIDFYSQRREFCAYRLIDNSIFTGRLSVENFFVNKDNETDLNFSNDENNRPFINVVRGLHIHYSDPEVGPHNSFYFSSNNLFDIIEDIKKSIEAMAREYAKAVRIKNVFDQENTPDFILNQCDHVSRETLTDPNCETFHFESVLFDYSINGYALEISASNKGRIKLEIVETFKSVFSHKLMTNSGIWANYNYFEQFINNYTHGNDRLEDSEQIAILKSIMKFINKDIDLGDNK